MELTNVVQETRDYERFKFLGANREQNRGHVEALKRAFEEMGNFTKVQPILVNDNFEIIDGQHRYTAAKELGEPIYFTIVPGLTVSDARTMNVLHRGWRVNDYAQSYAATDPSYSKYLQLREQYDYNHSVLLSYIYGGEAKTMFKDFREGQFVIENEAEARRRLDNLAEIEEVTPLAKHAPFAKALLVIMRSPDYDQKRMVAKLRLAADHLQKLQNTEDELREIEAAYNWKQKGDRVRLF